MHPTAPITAERIRSLHRTLHAACGLPAISPSASDQQAWWAFLREMTPLDEPEAGGPLTTEDIQAVIGEMRRQNNAGEAKWSLRPSRILRDPEGIRDLVLITRAKRRARPQQPPTPPITPTEAGVTRQIELPTEHEWQTASALLDTLRADLRTPPTPGETP